MTSFGVLINVTFPTNIVLFIEFVNLLVISVIAEHSAQIITRQTQKQP